ncbi:MAG: hypothetical protein IJ194_00770 [Bacilli bacterium]|nr:hypothetical protein [Bacilli bacterium]
MTEQEIFDKLLTILKGVVDDENYDFSSINMDSNIFQELAITSIAALYMALEIESVFHVTIQNENTERLTTVRNIIALIQEKQK